ncbi:microfibril-associated glycoprotein 4-like [Mytilus edulis]|uniref:microfibril-associated glycoprotein 4-like n=1 Tax=Mytilus edulis TaxID=6550 RepID=UPI0039EF099C
MYHVLAILVFTLHISKTDCGRTCLSCSDVKSVGDCSDVEVCADDEVCFTHKYITRTMEVSYDYGCTVHQFCSSFNSPSVIGKRRAGHHLVCQTCCNMSNICNIKSSCVNVSECSPSSVVAPDSKLPRECDDLSYGSSGVYTIYPDGMNAVQVYCIMANNEMWTVIQKRFNGYVSFDRTWEEYKSGFGSVSGEYWLGNDNIYQISTSTSHMLSIYMEDFTGKFAYANYSVFDIGDEHRKYQLRIDGFTGTSGLIDYLPGRHNTYMFSTKDQDNDIYAQFNCAVKQGGNGGWWYSNCFNVNLNGPYLAGPVQNRTAMMWLYWPTTYYSLKKSTMMIKRYSKRP